MGALTDVLIKTATNPKFDRYTAANGWQYYWVFRAANGETLCTSEMYNSQQAAENGIASLIHNIKKLN
ncbi:MAG: YegP family protein [Pseudomonadota bacterium]|mgnify:CR=1 FL=1